MLWFWINSKFTYLSQRHTICLLVYKWQRCVYTKRGENFYCEIGQSALHYAILYNIERKDKTYWKNLMRQKIKMNVQEKVSNLSPLRYITMEQINKNDRWHCIYTKTTHAHDASRHAVPVRMCALCTQIAQMSQISQSSRATTVESNMKNERNLYLACEDSSQHAYFFCTFSCSLLALLASTVHWLHCFLFLNVANRRLCSVLTHEYTLKTHMCLVNIRADNSLQPPRVKIQALGFWVGEHQHCYN